MKHFWNGFIASEISDDSIKFVLVSPSRHKLIVGLDQVRDALRETRDGYKITAVFVENKTKRRFINKGWTRLNHCTHQESHEIGVPEGKAFYGAFTKYTHGRPNGFSHEPLDCRGKMVRDQMKKGFTLHEVRTGKAVPRARYYYQQKLKKTMEKVHEFMKSGIDKQTALKAVRACACSHCFSRTATLCGRPPLHSTP